MIYVDTLSGILHLEYRYHHQTKELHKSYPVAIGRVETPTPNGKFHIVHKIICPELYYCDLEPHEKPFMGAASMHLNISVLGRPYTIHGSNPDRPLSVQPTGGCIAMLATDLIELFNWVRCGQSVIMWNEHYRKDLDFSKIPNYNRLRNWPEEKARPILKDDMWPSVAL